ncbi:MAG: hypothetical protein DHS20C18_47480 [Saprospiraceae bacterium]|nr:MAG: hypothetical protein DHS20C18_47480 [Saprospiraceae bacterium]
MYLYSEVVRKGVLTAKRSKKIKDMKNLYLTSLCFLVILSSGFSQSNFVVTNPEAEAVLRGTHDASNYEASTLINHPDDIVDLLLEDVSADTLKYFLEQMSVFGNRNTGSDTVSSDFGIGAARRWAFDQFQAISLANENRLVVSYFQFDQNICSMGQHRNIFGILPGVGPQKEEAVLVEAHFDSRCEDGCDPDCLAHGMEDNGSGSALVLELARVMSRYTFNRSIVFMLTIGEEQGLFGANAFAVWSKTEGIKLTAVLNNDIIGGVICGMTASPPGCPGLNEVDSINVRLYSSGNLNSKHKMLARFTKLEYEENITPLGVLPTVINIMTPEDRTGRGGDHIPFRQRGFPAVRFTSANEHGHGNPMVSDYQDRQHTMADVLGVDTNTDGILDSFFVDFNYLARNTIINGNTLAMAALGPVPATDFELEPVNNGFRVVIDDPNDYGHYRVGVRTFANNEFDTIYTFNQPIDTLYGLEVDLLYVISVATVDSNSIESLFIGEKFNDFASPVSEVGRQKGIELLQNQPNPFDEATMIGVRVSQAVDYKKASITVSDLNGRELAHFPIDLNPGLNEVLYDYRFHQYAPGTYAYSLVIDGKLHSTKRMIYAY